MCRIKLVSALLFFLSFSWNTVAQLSVGFSMQPNACQQENIEILNSSINSTQSEWDFCALDIERAPVISDVYGLPGFLGGFGYKMVSDNGLWYAFALNYTGNLLYRLDFGSDPQSTPQFVNLGNPNNALSKPQSIDLIKANGKWYGFIGYDAAGFGIVRLDFGTSLGNTPTATNIGAFGFSSSIVWDLRVVNQGGNLILLLLDRANDILIRINYRGSFDNTVSAGDIYPISSIPGASSLFSLDVTNQGVNWLVLLTSYFNNRVITLNFGSDLLQNFVSSAFFSSPILDQPIRVRIVKEPGKNYAMVSNNSAGVGMGLIDYGDFQTAPIAISTTLPALFSVDGIRSQGKTIVTGLGGSSTVKRLVFQNQCGASQETSNQFNPQGLTYSTPGLKDVSLMVKNSFGDEASVLKTILISSFLAPDIRFASQNICANGNVNFTSQNSSGNIASYTWNFGDTNSSSQPNPTHIYSSAATYPVTLQVTASNGCNNIAKSDVAIYNQPLADFSFPPANPLCTNQNYVFTNQSVFDAPSNPTWEWRLNGTLISSTQDLTQAFTSTTSQEIRLKAKLPGCENEIVKNINTLVPGPLVNFTSPSAGCQSTATAFTNTTTGSVTGYQWTFGDGNASSSTNATNTYTNIGHYNVTLQANNAAGCQNTATKSITVYTKPQPDFSVGLPPFSCAGTASQFTDATSTPTDSNITGWQWAFGDAANGTSTLRNPSFTYPLAGTYNVSLSTSTNFGCTNSLTKSITISPSPIANFTNAVACINQPTQFTDASTGSIRSRLWTIQSNSFSTPSVQFSFTNAGSFPVSLVVTGNNNCVSQFSKTINVPVQPSLDFSIQAPCTTNPTVFTEITSGADVPVSQLWNFGGLGNSTGSTAQFVFSTPNNYSVQLRSTRQSGCTYSITKNVSITQGPVADFTPSIDIGGPPLAVSFANTSTNANSYLWKFGDANNTTSTQTNPNFTFTDLGVYAVKLTAFNGLGCSFTTSKPITILVPSVNVVLSDFSLVPDQQTGVLQPMLNILNKSNVPITNPDVLLDVESSGLIKKKVIGKIQPNQSLSVPVDLQIVPRSATYICAEVDIANNTADFDKRRCLPLSSTEVLFSPYPNPAKDNLNFDWISNEPLPVNVVIFTSVGSAVFQQKFTSVATGLNRLELNTSTLPNGVYYIIYSDSKTTKSFSFTIAK